MKICVWMLRYVTLESVIFGDLEVWFISLSFPSVNCWVSINVNDSLVCTRESEGKEGWDSWYGISRCIYHVNTSVLYSGDPQVTTLMGNSHAPHKKEKSAKISIGFPMVSLWCQSESGFSENEWLTMRTSSQLSQKNLLSITIVDIFLFTSGIKSVK